MKPLFDAEKKEAFIKALILTCDVRAACRVAGTNWSTAYRHKKRYAGFRRRWEEAEQEALDAIVGTQYRAARGFKKTDGKDGTVTDVPPDLATGKWILARRRSAEWGETLTHRGDKQNPIDHEHNHVWELGTPDPPNHPVPEESPREQERRARATDEWTSSYMSFEVTKRLRFCYGHRLLDYQGQVFQYLHGHNGLAEVDGAPRTVLKPGRQRVRGGLLGRDTSDQVRKRWIDQRVDHVDAAATETTRC